MMQFNCAKEHAGNNKIDRKVSVWQVFPYAQLPMRLKRSIYSNRTVNGIGLYFQAHNQTFHRDSSKRGMII